MLKIKIAPSILSADFGKLNQEIDAVQQNTDFIHVDVMDGHFVDNISFGPPVIKHIKSKVPLDCHLMVKDPLKYAVRLCDYCDMISFHGELFTEKELEDTIKKIKGLGVKVGLALNPDKEVKMIEPVLKYTDFVVIMSVYAGFGGQKFIHKVLEKVKYLREELNYEKDIEIDGGINDETVQDALEAGANIIVAGSYIFNSKDKIKAIKDLKKGVVDESS